MNSLAKPYAITLNRKKHPLLALLQAAGLMTRVSETQISLPHLQIPSSAIITHQL